jgi:hypothetical protein
MSANQGTLSLPQAHAPRVWLWAGIVVVAIGLAFTAYARFGASGEKVSGAESTASASTTTMEQLVNAGLVPAATLQPSALERLVNAGLVPAETLEPKSVGSLYTAQDRALMAAVASGQVPAEVLESDSFVIKRLINQGLVPRQTLDH